jgi:hypothetical protein
MPAVTPSDHSAPVETDRLIVAQRTRLDYRQAENP